MKTFTKLDIAFIILDHFKAKRINYSRAHKIASKLYKEEYGNGDQITSLPYTNCFEIESNGIAYYAGQDYISEVSNFLKRSLK